MEPLLNPMIADLLALLLPAFSFSFVLVGAAIVAVFSRSPRRRAAARALLRVIAWTANDSQD